MSGYLLPTHNSFFRNILSPNPMDPYVIPRKIKSNRKNLFVIPKNIAMNRLNQKPQKRKGILLPLSILGLTNMFRKSGFNRLNAFNRLKGMKKNKKRKTKKTLQKMILSKLLKPRRRRRRSRRNKRKGDLTTDFLDEFGGLDFEPTTKSKTRTAFELARDTLINTLKDNASGLAGKAKNILLNKIKTLGGKNKVVENLITSTFQQRKPRKKKDNTGLIYL